MRRILLFIYLFVTVCSAADLPTTKPTGETTVVWVSIDGFRGDYLERIHAPTLQRLAKEGAFTTQETPIFPSLTFPNHIAQVTGVGVDHHGVPGNSFLETSTGTTYNFPDNASLIRAEPIWTTAKRQGLRVAVVDWPMSHNQVGPYKSDYFGERFDAKETDDHRLQRVVQLLNDDKGPSPLRLVMTYVAHVDTAGHKYGPDSPQVEQAVRDADASLGRFVEGVTAWFGRTHKPDDTLYILLTTDHGMEPVQTLVNLDRLVGGNLIAGATVVGGGPTGNVFLAPENRGRAGEIVAKLRTYPFVSAWQAKDIPAGFHYADPTRVGDLLVLLAPGYSFTSNRVATTMPATAGPKGMHSYDPAACPNMRGGAIVWRPGRPLGGSDLGPIDNTQWHATVAKLLGIEPAKGADTRAIDPK